MFGFKSISGVAFKPARGTSLNPSTFFPLYICVVGVNVNAASTPPAHGVSVPGSMAPAPEPQSRITTLLAAVPKVMVGTSIFSLNIAEITALTGTFSPSRGYIGPGLDMGVVHSPRAGVKHSLSFVHASATATLAGSPPTHIPPSHSLKFKLSRQNTSVVQALPAFCVVPSHTCEQEFVLWHSFTTCGPKLPATKDHLYAPRLRIPAHCPAGMQEFSNSPERQHSAPASEQAFTSWHLPIVNGMPLLVLAPGLSTTTTSPVWAFKGTSTPFLKSVELTIWSALPAPGVNT